ncbi:MAG: hypothetical protein R3B06_08185 [Kofleriaceae bacterium]
MSKLTAIVPIAAIVLAGAAIYARRGVSQPAPPDKLTIGIYAPSVEFGTAQVRLQYAQSLARAIEAQTGAKTEAKSFAAFAQLKASGVDFAIVDGQCYATSLGWPVLASAQVGGGTTRGWALFADGATTMQALRGKKLAYVQTGCNDNAFIDNAMLDSEVDPAFFAGRVGKPDLTAAVAEVASYKGAAAVFAPVGSQKGLTKVFDTGAVPNPAFVQLNSKLPAPLAAKVATAVVGFGGGGAISGWAAPQRAAYQSLAGAMGKSVKRGVFAAPDPVRFDAKDVLIEPTTLDDAALTGVRQHFERPPERME